MREITKEQLAEIIEKHRLWLRDEGGEMADLRSADLRYADLSYADLRSADLNYADLSYADLSSADLSYADLRYADLSYADLRYADLSYADLSYADLSYADLRSADLSYADLRSASLRDPIIWGATGNMGEIKSIALDTYPIAYTAEYLQIGCERHAIADWWGFDDGRISKMNSDAVIWWKKWKAFIQQAIELSPATPTGHEESNTEERTGSEQ